MKNFKSHFCFICFPFSFFLFLTMPIFDFLKKKPKEPDNNNVTAILCVIYYFNYAQFKNQEDAKSVTELYKRQMERWNKKLPNYITLLDMLVLTDADSNVDINFFNLDTTDKTKTEEVTKIITVLRNILRKQLEESTVNKPADFFDYAN